jgi:hypothetical protein
MSTATTARNSRSPPPQIPSLRKIRRPQPCLPADPHPRRILLGHWGYGPGGGAAPRSAPSPIRSLPRMGPPTRGTVEIAHPRRSSPASPRAGLRRVLLGHSRYDPRWGGASTPAHAQYDLCPGWAPDPGHWRYRPCALQPPPQLRGRSEVRPHGTLRAGPGGGRVHRQRPLNTISAPDGPIDPGHCGYPASKPPPQSSSIRSLPQMAPLPWGTAGIVASQPSRQHRSPSTLGVRRVVRVECHPPDTPVPLRIYMVGASHLPAIPFLPQVPPRTAQVARPRGRKPAYDLLPGGYPQGNRSMRGTRRIPCGAPRVQDPGHPPSGPGAMTVALSDRVRPPRRS